MSGVVPSHGNSGYKRYGCRCVICRAWRAERQRRSNARPVTSHGSIGYQRGCRCQTCLDWKSASNQRSRGVPA